MPNIKILVVDDEKVILLAFKAVLEKEGYYVKIATNGNTAVEILRSEPFDIIYTDLIMPGMNGIELIEEIKSISQNTKVALITGFSLEFLKDKPAMLKACENYKVLKKPINNSDILELTKELSKRETGEKLPK